MGSSALISIFPGNEFVGESHACIGIDIQAPLAAPSGECIRVEVNLFNEMPLSGELLESLVRLFQPFDVGVRELP